MRIYCNSITTEILEDVSVPTEKLDSRVAISMITISALDNTLRGIIVEGGEAKIRVEQSSTLRTLDILAYEWPEIANIVMKLIKNQKLSSKDEQWINEIAEVTGWRKSDIIDDLMNINAHPSERVKRYRKIFEEYYEEALKLKEKGNTRQASEKLWGATTALVKLYAAIKGIPIMHWSRGKIESFITDNVETKYRKLFRDLLDKAQILHEHFYEGCLDSKTFEERWNEAIEPLEKVKKIVLSKLSKS